MIKLLRAFSATFIAAIFLIACAETPDGTIVMNEETIENFIEGDREGKRSWDPAMDLNLVHNQPVIPASIPALPPGQIRLAGPINSVGPYKITAKLKDNFPGATSRGSTFSDSVFGKLGPAGNGGNAWLYVDIDPATGSIVAARAYLYNFLDGVCDMRRPSSSGFGSFSASGFSIYIDGPCLFPSQSGSTSEFALVVQGAGEPLASASGATFPIRYVMTDSAKIKEIPRDPKARADIYDYGSGTLTLIK